LVISRARIWWNAARWLALPNTVTSAVLGGLIALANGKFDPVLFAIALAGLVAVHLGTNLLDDYADLKISGFTSGAADGKLHPRKAPYVVSGTLKLNHVLYVSLGLFSFGVAACVYLTIVSGWLVAAIAATAAIICFFYSMPPLSLGYRGMGEIIVALATGPGICLGTYYAVTQTLSWEPVFVGLTIGILVGLILYIHSIMDYHPDQVVKKKTLVALIGDRHKAIQLLSLAFALAYGLVIAGVVLAILPLTALLMLLSSPLALKVVQTINELDKGEYEPVEWKWWMGPRGQKRGGRESEWFMTRWYLTRNTMLATALLAFVAYAIDIVL